MLKYKLKEPPSFKKTRIDYRRDLNDEQYEVVTKADGPCLVLAGAGSGKTRTLIYRLAYLLEQGINPKNIMLVTFTNKAARNMQDRVEMLLKAKPKGLWNGTFHHIGNRSLRLYARAVGFREDFGILDKEDSKDLLKVCMKTLRVKAGEERFPKPGVIQSIISYSINSRTDIEKILRNSYPYFLKFEREVVKIKELYELRKKQSNNMDYDDLLIMWLRLLEENEEARERFSRQFKFVLVDEYQDTNVLQSDIIQHLASHHENVLVVGDDAQAIYSFRGATVRNILEFPKIYPDAKIFKLETNYRSSPEILDLANDSISHNKDQFKKTLHAVNSPIEKPVLIEPRDLYYQAGFIAQRVLELRDEGIPLSDIAVLFRAHYQSAELQMELVKRGIPYVVRGGVRFFEQAHIKDALSFLKIASNPFDEISWIRALSLQPGIGSIYADRLYREYLESRMNLQDVVKKSFGAGLPQKARAGLGVFKKIIKAILNEDVRGKPDIAIKKVLQNGYENYVKMNFENASDRIDDLHELASFAHSYKTQKSFLRDITLRESFKGETLGGAPSHDEYLVLTTIHQAKGLEWKAVFLIGLCEGQFPHPKAIEEPIELEEERRLFYVAATRTKQQLYLIHPITRYDYQMGTVISRRSLFLDELNGKLYTTWELEEGSEPEEIEIDLEET